ncbi:hypothetical protein ACJX0J_005787, partial [Zea mays]
AGVGRGNQPHFLGTWEEEHMFIKIEALVYNIMAKLSKIYGADFSDYERTCLMDQLLLFIDETHMF